MLFAHILCRVLVLAVRSDLPSSLVRGVLLAIVALLHLFPQCAVPQSDDGICKASSDRTGQSAPPLYSLGLAAFPQQDNIVSLLACERISFHSN